MRHSVLEQGNLKLSQVASDIVGVSCRKVLRALSEGESDPARLASLTQGRLKATYVSLVEALDGQIRENDRWLVGRLLEQVEKLEEEIEVYSDRIRKQMKASEEQLSRLETIGGVGRRSAENLLAEIGPDMSPFRTDDELVSWGGNVSGEESFWWKKPKQSYPRWE